MTLTRWKLLAGLLGLSMGGVAATADPQCRIITAAPPAPCPVVIDVPVIPAPAVVTSPKPVTPPKVTPEPAPAPKPAEPKVIELPMPTTPVEKPAGPMPTVPELPPPLAAAPDQLTLPTVTTVGGTAPVVAPAADPPPLPAPVADPPKTVVTAEPPAPKRLDPPAVPNPAMPIPAPTPSVTLVPAPPADAGNVRVVLKLGAGQPRFEVLSGDDTLLKVVSDKVDVTSPSAKGETMSALKAAGGVRFSAPGCEGTCTELTVLPGSGDVQLAGDVRVRCKQGKGETVIEAGKMMFKLGSAPAYSVSEPDTGTVNISHTAPAKK